jgi:hypothetical protein
VKPLPRYAEYVRTRSATNWENYIRALEAAGRAVQVGGVTVDGESVFRRRFSCDTRECSPTRRPGSRKAWRESGLKSCCADLVVDLAPLEVQGLERHWPAIRESLAAKDAFFEGKDARDMVEMSGDFEVSLRKRAGRCIFAIPDPEWGLRCGVHAACLERGIPLREAKPVVCDTFPLLVIDLDHARTRFYLGAHDEASEGIAGLGEYGTAQFPCLARNGKGDPLFRAMESTLRAYFGDAWFEECAAAAESYLARPRPRKVKPPEV